MRILKSPIVGDTKIDYTFSGETITATINGVADTFDFSGMPEGEIYYSEIETPLDPCPIVHAFRADGVLSVEILNFITDDATEEEKFPTWIEV